jgi:hypothetical protein
MEEVEMDQLLLVKVVVGVVLEVLVHLHHQQ